MACDHPFCREEVTRTPDPYVPNVVRYQLRYFSLTFVRFDYLLEQIFSKAGAKVLLFFELCKFFCNYFALFRLKVRFPGFKGSDCAMISFTSASVSASPSVPFGSR